MNRIYILLVVPAIQIVGCSEQSVPPATPSETRQTKDSEKDADLLVPITHDGTTPPAPTSEVPPPDTDPAGQDAMSLYRASQALMKEGKLEEGYESARKAMQQFVAEDVDLPWMMLESIQAGDNRIDVHFNMGERERKMPEDGIVRPLSFRIWSGGDDSTLLQVIDFEIGRSNGQSLTAAIGEMTESGHANYGILDVDASYKDIRQRVIELVTQE